MKRFDLGDITAWNAVRFRSPVTWRISELGARHLVMADDSGPRMEIKWEALKGGFSPKTWLRRLNKRHKGRMGGGARIAPVPESWAGALERFDHEGFSWRAGDRMGRGVILHCRQCGTVSVIHFYSGADDPNAIPWAAILDTFEDHPGGDGVVWSVFGFRAVVPEGYRLSSHRFGAGVADLVFARGRRTLRLLRWGPASVLLEKSALAKVGARGLTLPEKEARDFAVGGYRGLQWQTAPGPGRRFAVLGRLIGGACFRRSCLWHVPEKNRILGVQFSSTVPFETDEMEFVISRYETL